MRLAVLLLLVTLAASGCLKNDPESVAGECAADLSPSQVPADAKGLAGPGPRGLEIFVLDETGSAIGNAAVTAWWQEDGDPRIHVVRLRTGPSGIGVLRVPEETRIEILGGRDVWTHEASVSPGTGTAEVTLVSGGMLGEDTGTWSQPVTIGNPTPEWQPTDLPWADPARLQRLESLTLSLAWTNAPQGGADFGIAVGAHAGFQYWNQETQANLGTFTETLELDRATMDEFGWTDASYLRAGPSVSTGAYSATGIDYTLAWDARFAIPDDLGNLCSFLPDAQVVDDSLAQPPAYQ